MSMWQISAGRVVLAAHVVAGGGGEGASRPTRAETERQSDGEIQRLVDRAERRGDRALRLYHRAVDSSRRSQGRAPSGKRDWGAEP